MSNPTVFEDQAALAIAAAERFATLAVHTIKKHGRFVVALSGGNTPQKMHSILREMNGIDWSKIFIFWGDERFVPPEDSESNFASIYSALLKHIPIPEINIFPYATKNISPEESAQKNIDNLKKVFKNSDMSFDLIFLGIGPDGHTASLFPNLYKPTSNEDLILVINDSPKPPSTRLSFSIRLINQAKEVIMLVSGKEKAPILKEILENLKAKNYLPAAMVNPPSGNIRWFVDREAASELTL